MLWPKIIEQYSYKNKFLDAVVKKSENVKFIRHSLILLEKGFMFERPTLQGVNLVVRLNEEQTLIEDFFLHNDPHKSAKYLIFFEDVIIIETIPKPLSFCEELFDRNVLKIKKLVKDIGDLTPLIHKEQKTLFLYDDSNIITDTFLTEINKNIQTYGLISLEYNHYNDNLINSRNRLHFKIKYNISKEFITLQLEDILTPKKLETEDSKITNFSILSTDKFKMQIKHEFKIEGFQNFEKYSEINPVNIKITNSEIQNSLLFYARKYKYRFIGNSLLFSSSLKTDTNAIFIITNGVNDAKELLINGKLFQGIGTIFTSEIDGWKNILKNSHWTNAVLTDSQNPIAAKHFAFGFETTD